MGCKACSKRANNWICYWTSKKLGKEILAEFLGTFFFVSCGLGITAFCILNQLEKNAILVHAFGWGLAYTATNCMMTPISGGHANPALTLSFASVKRCFISHVWPYIIAQYVGSFAASGVVYLCYSDAIGNFGRGEKLLPPRRRATAQIFAVYPQEWQSEGAGLWNEIIGSALFSIVALGATDKHNLYIFHHAQAIIMGLGLSTIILIFGPDNGAAINPARDFAPRVFTALCGWGVETISFRGYKWFPIPAFSPYLGGIIGAWIYRIAVEIPFSKYGKMLREEERMAARERNRLRDEERKRLLEEKARQKDIDSALNEAFIGGNY